MPPALVDPDTGYRYYKPSQLGILSAIQVCIELGIPLQKFPDYYSDGKINAARFLEDAAQAARQRIKAIQDSMDFIEKLQAQMAHADKLIQANGSLEYDLPEQRYLICEIPQDITIQAYNKALAQLHKKAVEMEYGSGLSFGKMAIFHDRKIEKRFAYIEVSADAKGDSVLTLSPRRYCTIRTEKPQIEQAVQLFPEYFSDSRDVIVLESEIISSIYQAEEPDHELRCTYR